MARKTIGFVGYVFVVEGTGEFPTDMLRYDSARPLRAEDQRVVNARHEGGDDTPLWSDPDQKLRRNRVTLVTESPNAPTHGRWQSYTWKVVEGRRPPTFAEREEIRRNPQSIA